MSSEMERESDRCANELLMTADSECQNCIQQDLAVAHCKDCNKLLCGDCLQQHKRQRDTNKHEMIASPFADEIRSRYQCKDHKKSLDYFCEVCSGAVCDHCTKTTCKDHKILVRTEIETEIQRMVVQVKENESKFKEHKVHIEALMTKNETSFNDCKTQIKNKFQELAESLEAKKQKLLQELEEAKARNDVIDKEQQAFVEDKLRMMNESIAASENLLASPTDAKLMVNRKDTLDELGTRREYSWSKEEAPPRAWQLINKPIRDYALGFGELIPKPRPEDIVISGLDEGVNVGIVNKFTVSVGVPDTVRREDISVVLTLKEAGNQSRSNGTLIRHTITEMEKNKWAVSFSLFKPGTVSVSVTACRVTKGTPINIPTENVTLKEGDKVERGPDWKWENQDGGEGNVGEVVGVKKGWVMVRWKNDRKTYDYRWGAKSMFDLKPHKS